MPGKSGQFVGSVLSSREASVRGEAGPKGMQSGASKAIQHHAALPAAWLRTIRRG